MAIIVILLALAALICTKSLFRPLAAFVLCIAGCPVFALLLLASILFL